VFKFRVFVASLLLVAAAAAPRADSGSFAITNARIVPVSGPAIDRGTIVVSRGVISALGASVQVPADAWVIDGKGLTVYPGLIDALTDLGLPQPAQPAAGGRGAGGRGAAALAAAAQGTQPPPARGPEDRPASTPWLQAADEIKTDDARIDTWRNAGFTTALSAPRTGIFPGQGAVINLAKGERAGEMVVLTPASFQINMTPPGNFGSFPGALMGVVAYVRQVYDDVQHESDVRKAYESARAGVERPAYDRTVRAVAEAQAAGRPTFLPATTPVQIDRELTLADEWKIKPVLYGLHEGYRSIDRLAAHKTPVLVSLKWPEKDPNGDPDAVESLRILRERDKAPGTPAALQKAGVKFAFYSDGAQPKDLIKNVKKAIDAGLPNDAALKALTQDAADILGVGARLGSLEPGKVANLTITDGDLFADSTKIKMVFIDGAKYEVYEQPPQREGRPGTTAGGAAPTGSAPSGSMPSATPSLTGHWTLTYTTGQGAETATADLTQGADGAISGSLAGAQGTAKVTTGSITGNRFTFSAIVPHEGNPLNVVFTGTIDGNTLTGTLTAGDFSTGFTATRPGRGGRDS
jgi:imidazolonepropionase-like amidohydrolase